ncbi:MAG TPA: SH3 domain-containing protein [Actinoplanes sp.]|nr:SH3 domain-containing protein [Actinoplanes sp.]
MAAEQVQNPPSLSKRLSKQWRWVAIAVAIVALAILSKSAEARLTDFNNNRPDKCQVEVNADVLNVRAGPGTDTPSVGKLSRGDVVDAEAITLNGFRKLGENRWVSQSFVTASTACG